MKRNIIKIDKEKCNGCGLCVNACHEGALKIVDGKATLVSDSYCDGLGACLPACPTDAIKVIEREADAFDEKLVAKTKFTCPSSISKVLKPKTEIENSFKKRVNSSISEGISNLGQWPCQIKLVAPNAPFFNGAKLLIAADCSAFAYPNIQELMQGKITLIGCPKLDGVDYSEKLSEIILNNDIKSISVVRMEVPCCGGLYNAVKSALEKAKKIIPFSVTTIGISGNIVDEL